MPERIQLRRTKGWRKPEGAIVVARPTRFGNPFLVFYRARTWHVGDGGCNVWAYLSSQPEANQYAADAYRAWIVGDADLFPEPVPLVLPTYATARARIQDGLELLRGKDLACYCPLLFPCHADVLLELANA